MDTKMHDTPHPLSGKRVTITAGQFAGETYRIEDWWDRVAGKSWTVCDGNPACLEYAMRSASEGTGISDEVVYGHIGSFGKLIHVSQLGDVAEAGHAA
jgi:hypothetical protein